VVPYLSEEAIFATHGFIARLPGSADVVFDYVKPTEAITSQPARCGREALQARVSSLGEGIQSYFDSERLGAKMAELGFRSLNDFGPAQLAARFFLGRVSSGGSAHIMHASTRS
jgi:O-methyltransferase involved in polyketide biosynthesis